MNTYYVYILASKRNGTLYIGVTNNLEKRAAEHKLNLIDGFTASALYLANYGAGQKTYSAEIAAAKAYISGSPSCSSYICNFYSSEIQRIAALIDQSL